MLVIYLLIAYYFGVNVPSGLQNAFCPNDLRSICNDAEVRACITVIVGYEVIHLMIARSRSNSVLSELVELVKKASSFILSRVKPLANYPKPKWMNNKIQQTVI